MRSQGKSFAWPESGVALSLAAAVQKGASTFLSFQTSGKGGELPCIAREFQVAVAGDFLAGAGAGGVDEAFPIDDGREREFLGIAAVIPERCGVGAIDDEADEPGRGDGCGSEQRGGGV